LLTFDEVFDFSSSLARNDGNVDTCKVGYVKLMNEGIDEFECHIRLQSCNHYKLDGSGQCNHPLKHDIIRKSTIVNLSKENDD
jgi:hypothetical protein